LNWGINLIEINFYDNSWKIEFENLNLDYKIELAVSDIKNIFEHEETVPKIDLIDELVSSYNKIGFLNPILVTKLKNKYIIADGTHRLFALQKIAKEKGKNICCLLYVISPLQLKRSSWTLVFENNLPLKKFVDHGFLVEKFDNSDFNNYYLSLINGEFQCIIRSDGTFYRIYKNIPDRLEFLKSIKTIDNILGDYFKLISIKDEKEFPDNLALLAPPIDIKGDIELLVNHKELRRKKGSKTDVPLRTLFFGIPLKNLFQNEKDLSEFIIRKINNLIKSKKLIFIKPPLDIGGLINPINYNAIIMDKDLFYNYIGNMEINEEKIIKNYKVL
jgi:hypothetical protein